MSILIGTCAIWIMCNIMLVVVVDCNEIGHFIKHSKHVHILIALNMRKITLRL